MKKSTNIIMVEDHPEYREIVEMAISRQEDMQLTISLVLLSEL